VKILVLSKYSRKGASSRYRMFQYFPSLTAKGVELTTQALFDDNYIDLLYSKKNRAFSVLKAYLGRFLNLSKSNSFDLLWIEKELFPWVPWFVEKWFLKLLNTPFVVDYDDAIFHQYDLNRSGVVRWVLGNKCDQVMKHAACVVAGNQYLGARARAAGAKKVVIIPTVVSEKIFKPASTNNQIPVIGWIGSMSTAVYLEKLRPVLKKLSKEHSFKVRVVGATVGWDDVPVECISWSESQEVALVQSFDIGVMPLLDSPWERGKCGFKLIQYMACGKSVVADAVGVNSEIVLNGDSGYLVTDKMNWEDSLKTLLVDAQLRNRMGEVGLERFKKHYSLECWQDFLFNLFVDCKVKDVTRPNA
jgi:glycosyltransferase involved in cell wall biosynthesis